MLSSVKTNYTPLIEIIAKPFLAVEPNVLTLVGLLFPAGFFYFMIHGAPHIAVLLLIGSTFDMIDGAVARLKGKTSVLGAVLDSACDRLSDGLLIAAFAYGGYISLELMLITLIGAYLISYIRSRAELAVRGTESLAIGLMERTERIIALLAITILCIAVQFGFAELETITYAFVFFSLLCWYTVGQRLWAIRSW
ncbi:MAG: CDP-diacylglycerol--inositol 3-phosphatidyltransferase [Microgenomates bacterium OLB22]|nr:MAG: CDP-diacylglycerol--inositol 3-phosphatidyltransferase [Microgenomates bacterium OLB22]